jgi:hypothetical protein
LLPSRRPNAGTTLPMPDMRPSNCERPERITRRAVASTKCRPVKGLSRCGEHSTSLQIRLFARARSELGTDRRMLPCRM